MTKKYVLGPELSGSGVPADVSAANPASDSPVRIDADLLIPGRGEPIKKATLVYRRKHGDAPATILFVGATAHLSTEFIKLSPTTSVPVLMPGMWDCHVHYLGNTSLKLDELASVPPSVSGFRAARDVVATLNAGFTSVREVGGYGVDISKVIDEGWIPGPHIYSAGAVLSQTAGHGDFHDIPLEQMHQCIDGHGRLPLCLTDGVDSAVLAVRTQIRRGAKVIKICSTGGVLSAIDSPHAAQFNQAELNAIVEEATRTGLQVASHAHGTAGIMSALHAGVKTIEHGSFLTQEAIDLMLEKDVILCATRTIQEVSLQIGEKVMPPVSFAKLKQVAHSNFESYKAAIKAGVRCALGTDLGISSTTFPFNHGMNGLEFNYAVQAGMTPLQAIEAGTATGPETLGLPKSKNALSPAPLSGQLKKGYDADFIALEENPLEDIAVLGKAEKIVYVWKEGEMVKWPGHVVGVI